MHVYVIYIYNVMYYAYIMCLYYARLANIEI